ncbi:MAG: PLP-dependent aspartate aminotransferase family protein [Clostridia bacterium]|nr:PLP-dependent aspartate aminotransferase family protein [Clostridia bacterium]
MHITTQLAHLGVGRDPRTGSISTPIYQCATFAHPALGESTGYDYSRSGNPTRQALEEAIAQLEGGVRGFAFSSGMAAITSILLLLQKGDHLVVTEDLYGGTYRLLEQIFNRFDLSATYVDTSDLGQVEKAIKSNTRAILVESPTNPLLKVADLAAIGELAKSRSVLYIVDNTFMTPYLQKPLDFGADIVIHSATKYLGGHNDVVAGLVVVKDPELADKVYFLQNGAGAILGPQDSWLIIRGLKTLGLRLDRQQANSLTIARWLEEHPQVEKVYYPGLPNHPGHKLLSQQAKGFGGMISFTVKEAALVEQVLAKVKLIPFAESLGGVETLITFPAKQTHCDIPPETRARLGVCDCLLRLSVGIEHPEDLIADLEQALD